MINLVRKAILVSSFSALLITSSCMSGQKDVFEKGDGSLITFEIAENDIITQRFLPADEDTTDARTLKWYSFGDTEISWVNASRFADTLTIDGGEWRLPTLEELRTLKHDGSSMYNISSLFGTNGWFLWSSERDGESSFWGLDLHDGAGYESRHFEDSYVDSRVFVVKELN